jgi:hypothetical protein
MFKYLTKGRRRVDGLLIIYKRVVYIRSTVRSLFLGRIKIRYYVGPLNFLLKQDSCAISSGGLVERPRARTRRRLWLLPASLENRKRKVFIITHPPR